MLLTLLGMTRTWSALQGFTPVQAIGVGDQVPHSPFSPHRCGDALQCIAADHAPQYARLIAPYGDFVTVLGAGNSSQLNGNLDSGYHKISRYRSEISKPLNSKGDTGSRSAITGIAFSRPPS